MLKIVDIIRVGDMISITVEGNASEVKNGSKLYDKRGNIYAVVSVGMSKYIDPHDVSKFTTLLLMPCDLEKGMELFTA